MNHRVLHFLWKGSAGGAARAIWQLVREEIARGEWDVGVAFGQAQGEYATAIARLGCEVIDLDMRSGSDLWRAFRGTQKLKMFDIHHFHSLELGQMAASLTCAGTTRVYTHRHGIYLPPEPAAKRLRRSIGGAILRKHFHALSGNTQHATQFAIEHFHAEGLPSCVTYNGLDFSLLEPKIDRTQVRLDLGVANNQIVIASSGVFKPEKRYELLVDTLAGRQDTHVLLIGDGPLRTSLEAYASRQNLSHRLHITGFVDNVADYVQAADVFVLPSSAEESFGNSLIEAMALGVPSIVFADSPGLCEHVVHGVTGFIASDIDKLSSIVKHLSSEPETRRRVGMKGHEYVHSTYTLINMHNAYRRLHEMALENRGI